MFGAGCRRTSFRHSRLDELSASGIYNPLVLSLSKDARHGNQPRSGDEAGGRARVVLSASEEAEAGGAKGRTKGARAPIDRAGLQGLLGQAKDVSRRAELSKKSWSVWL
jgi:hypothetical protein